MKKTNIFLVILLMKVAFTQTATAFFMPITPGGPGGGKELDQRPSVGFQEYKDLVPSLKIDSNYKKSADTYWENAKLPPEKMVEAYKKEISKREQDYTTTKPEFEKSQAVYEELKKQVTNVMDPEKSKSIRDSLEARQSIIDEQKQAVTEQKNAIDQLKSTVSKIEKGEVTLETTKELEALNTQAKNSFNNYRDTFKKDDDNLAALQTNLNEHSEKSPTTKPLWGIIENQVKLKGELAKNTAEMEIKKEQLNDTVDPNQKNKIEEDIKGLEKAGNLIDKAKERIEKTTNDTADVMLKADKGENLNTDDQRKLVAGTTIGVMKIQLNDMEGKEFARKESQEMGMELYNKRVSELKNQIETTSSPEEKQKLEAKLEELDKSTNGGKTAGELVEKAVMAPFASLAGAILGKDDKEVVKEFEKPLHKDNEKNVANLNEAIEKYEKDIANGKNLTEALEVYRNSINENEGNGEGDKSAKVLIDGVSALSTKLKAGGAVEPPAEGQPPAPAPGGAGEPPAEGQPPTQPAASDREQPAAADREQPPAPNREQPAAADREQPPAPNREQPAGADREQPPAPNREQPAAADRGQPAAADREQPAAVDREQPAAVDREQAAAADREQPAAVDREQPAAPDREQPPAPDM